MNINAYRQFGKALEDLLCLRFSPVALCTLQEDAEIPDGYLQPSKALGGRFAACQGFAMVRREGKKLAMLREDNSCIWPMIGWRMAEFDESDYDAVNNEFFHGAGNLEYHLFIQDPGKAKEFFLKRFPRLSSRRKGLLLAPLTDVDFTPELVILYLRPAQLRSALMAAKYKTADTVKSEFDSVQSCLYSTVFSLENGSYSITVPDPGEYKRAMCDEDEMIFTLPAAKLPEFIDALRELAAMGLGFRQLNRDMTPMGTEGLYDAVLSHWNLL